MSDFLPTIHTPTHAHLCTEPIQSHAVLTYPYIPCIPHPHATMPYTQIHLFLSHSVGHKFYRIAGNFHEVYILRFLQFDQFRNSLRIHKIVNITIQMRNTNTQIAKLIPRKACLSAKSQFFVPHTQHMCVANGITTIITNIE